MHGKPLFPSQCYNIVVWHVIAFKIYDAVKLYGVIFSIIRGSVLSPCEVGLHQTLAIEMTGNYA